MVKHIVFFKLSKSLTPENKKFQLERMKAIFSTLGNKFPFIVDYKTGVNFNDSIFRNREDLQKYQDSEDHQQAIKEGSKIEKIKAVIDYEF
jgi:hypothetical protein